MFSDLLKSLRNKRGVSQPQLAKAVGVSPGNISDWETGRSKPGYVALAALSRFFEVSSDYLLELDDTPVKTGGSLSCDGVELSSLESDLVAMFRLLPDAAKKEVFDLLHFKYTRLSDGEKESIFWTYFDESSDVKSSPADDNEGRSGTA